MKFINKDIEQVVAYLDGELEDKDLEALEKRLTIDPDFKELANEMSTLIKGIKKEGRESMLQDLRKLDKTLPDINSVVGKKSPVRKIIMAYWNYGVAAVLIIALLLNLNPGIPKEYQNPYSPNIFRSSNNPQVTSIFTEPGFSSYLSKDYRAAVMEFESIEPKTDTVWFYLGNTYFAQRKYGKALVCYEDESLAANTIFSDDAKWYAALCMMAARQFSEASEKLNDLSRQNTIYSGKAQKLLEKRRFK